MVEQKKAMSTNVLRSAVIITLYCVSAAWVYGAAQKSYGLAPVSGSRIWLSGTSTLHPYTSIASNFSMRAGVAFSGVRSSVPEVVTLSVSIPITNLKCEIGGLDNNLYETMKYKEVPNITFTIRKCELSMDPKNTNRYIVLAKGDLAIAGKDREITLNAVGELTDRTLKIYGTKDVLMTDFGISPPSLMFGLIVCGDKISVGWELIFSVQMN